MNDSADKTPGNERPEDETPFVAKLVQDDATLGSSSDGDSRAESRAESQPGETAAAETIESATSELEKPELATAQDPEAGNPFAATGKAVRVGSPFASEPEGLWDEFLPTIDESKPEILYDVGPLKYTAIGAVSAAVMLVVFALAAFYWFPVGGAMIAALGCAMSIFGLYSPKKKTAGGCLVTHLGLFLASYSSIIAG